MTEKSPLFIIDGHSLIYRSFYAIKHLSNTQGQPTNAVFGFVKILLKIFKVYDPHYLCIVFDPKGPTVRQKHYEDYKLNRKPMPEELISQVPLIMDLVKAFNIPLFQVSEIEADDVIATLAFQAQQAGFPSRIISNDKDIFQIASKTIKILNIFTEECFGPREVREKMGVNPEQITDYLALMGDASDNVPGVPGIGKKTAQRLLQKFPSIEVLLSQLEDVDSPRIKQLLKEHASEARLSKELVILDTAVNLPVFSIDTFTRKKPDNTQLNHLFIELNFTSLATQFSPKTQDIPSIDSLTIVPDNAKHYLPALSKEKELFFHVHAEDLHLTTSQNTLYLISLDNLALLKPLLSAAILKTGYDLKQLYHILHTHHIDVKGPFFDLMLADQFIDFDHTGSTLEELIKKYLPEKYNNQYLPQYHTLLVPELAKILENLLQEQSGEHLFSSIEMPLISVLADLELKGIKMDIERLRNLEKSIQIELQKIKAGITDVVGQECNINSPKELQVILFEKLQLKPVKKTKTGFSTDATVLKKLSKEHPLPEKILSARHMEKMLNTYIKPLLVKIHPDTARIHTHFNQIGTATGRLSSSNPNLQNIPLHSPFSSSLRSCFIHEPGNILLSGDYSQIELRILAHLSNDPMLIESFNTGKDIHTQTAAAIFSIAPEDVSAEQRYQAKTVNFGILYGMTPAGLAEALSIKESDAEDFITHYFSLYKEVKSFLVASLEKVKKIGYITTQAGRRRSIPYLNSPNPVLRHAAERMAVNAPIQGMAADIMKKAMIECFTEIQSNGYDAAIILQVHDELIIEAPKNELIFIEELVQRIMQSTVKLRVPLTVNITYGNSWNDL